MEIEKETQFIGIVLFSCKKMNWIDFLIGFTCMNAMPHITLGIWRSRMLSGFGFGHSRNILWGFANLGVSLTLFIMHYGIAGFYTHAMYTGSLVMLIMFSILGPLWYRIFNK